MKRLSAILAMLCVSVSAYAVQEVTLKDTPPLEPIHYCKHADGNVLPQNGKCDSGDTDVGDAKAELQPDGHTVIYHEAPKEAPPIETNRPTIPASGPSAEQDAASKGAIMHDARIRIAKWLGFAAVIGVLAKLLNRSFFLWFILGFVLRMVLVAANVMAF